MVITAVRHVSVIQMMNVTLYPVTVLVNLATRDPPVTRRVRADITGRTVLACARVRSMVQQSVTM